jgi:glycosyltransferase involved in cell wall biosynthesis
MNLSIIIYTNPFIQSSAYANRWLTLIEGLAKLEVQIKLIIYGGYQSKQEAEDWTLCGERNGIGYKYIESQLVTGYVKQRYYAYIGSSLREGKLTGIILKELESQAGIVWTDASHFGFRLAVKIKSRQPDKRLFLEMSEFLDIHKYNKGNFLQRWKADRREQYFNAKAFYAYDGIAWMTKTLLNHYSKFPHPHPAFLHLPMTVDLDRFSKETSQPEEFIKPYIAFVGVMDDAKDGANILIEAFANICSQFPNYRLYLIGSWNYDTPNHLKLIKKHDLMNKVFWMKEYPRDSIPSILKNASLLVLPRPASKQAQGGFPTKLGEYLATGNPVCATTVGEIPDYLVDGESVYFAEPGSVESFAHAMQRALSNPDESKRIGMNGRKVAEKYFNKDIQAKILFDFLKENLQANSN